MHRLDPGRALRLVGVAFLVYLGLLVPWKLVSPAYTAILAPPAEVLSHALGAAVDIDARGPDLAYVRVFDEARTTARDDLAVDPILFQWMRDLFGPLHRAMYAFQTPDGAASRATPVTQLVSTFRLTLELPLFLALLVALPGVPWRRRLKPLGTGLSILVPLHLFLAVTPAFWLAAAAGHLRASATGVELAGPDFWLQFTSRYQYVGPVLAFVLFLTLFFFGLFDPKPERKRAPADRPSPAADGPPQAPPDPPDASPSAPKG